MLSPSRITLENNEKIWPEPDRENAFEGASGGGDGPAVQPSPHAHDAKIMIYNHFVKTLQRSTLRLARPVAILASTRLQSENG